MGHTYVARISFFSCSSMDTEAAVRKGMHLLGAASLKNKQKEAITKITLFNLYLQGVGGLLRHDSIYFRSHYGYILYL